MRSRIIFKINIQSQIIQIKVVLEPSDEGGYTVYVPSLPVRISEGETLEEACL